MVEEKCRNVDHAQAAAAAQEVEARTNLASDHWNALIALHRTLLHEHHDFFLASQHPSSSPALRRLAGEYSMPARMWCHGIYTFLQLLRRRLPESMDYMLAFIHLAYQMVALLYETVPAFEDMWMECLGNIGYYRITIEKDVSDRDMWIGVARSWYVKAADKNPTVGRLYHHLAILARPRVLLQMYYHSRSLASVKPFQRARESMKELLDPIVKKAQHTPLDDLSKEEVFVLAHASQFNHSSIKEDSFGINKPTAKFSAPKEKFFEKLDIYSGHITSEWKDLGVHVAVANIAGWFYYGEDKNLIRHAFLQQLYPPTPQPTCENAVIAEAPSDEQEKSKEKEEVKIPETAEAWKKEIDKMKSDNCHYKNAKLLTNETSALVFRRRGENVLPHVHVMLAFLFNVASSKHISSLIADAPWTELVAFLNALIKTTIRLSQSKNEKQDINTLLATDLFSREGKRDDKLPLPEDYHIRGQIWAQHFPEKWFERKHDEEERYLELAKWPSSVLRHVPVTASHSRTVLSLDADATSCPSGEKATALTTLEWPFSVLRHVPVAASHRRTVSSPDADATRCPSGEKATAMTGEEWPSSVLQHVPVAASHSRTVLSPDADATRCPSGEKATIATGEEWPSSMLRHAPVATSHSRTVLSPDADATSSPSGEKATAVTNLEWPLSVLQRVPVAASHSRTVVSSDADATNCPSGEKATALT
ncbi:EST1-DNA-bind domain containing protein [Pyrenophora tritici-repentis]|nr:EST1-DNA-bind domain containing protein [Pyrenophora tritici-repentis]